MKHIVLFKNRFSRDFKVYNTLQEAEELKQALKEDGYIVYIVSTEQEIIF